MDLADKRMRVWNDLWDAAGDDGESDVSCYADVLPIAVEWILDLERELHSARAWTLGPTINSLSRSVILEVAKHLRSLFDTNKSECNLIEVARIVEEFAFRSYPKTEDNDER